MLNVCAHMYKIVAAAQVQNSYRKAILLTVVVIGVNNDVQNSCSSSGTRNT